MKLLHLPLLCILCLTSSLRAQSEDTKALWIKLSAEVQNTHHQLNSSSDVALRSKLADKAAPTIDTILDKLVAAGELQSQLLELNIPELKKGAEHDGQNIALLKPAIAEIAKLYGEYTAMEMCDIGARFQIKPIQANSTIKTHIRLPKQQMASYLAHLKKSGFIQKIPSLEQPTKPAHPEKQHPYNDELHWFPVDRYAKRALLIIHALDTAEEYGHLPYKFGSANPSNGGFDCSGATSYVLKKAGLEPPRTSAQQFIWIRDQGKIQLIGKKITSVSDPTFDALLPGDLVFWSGTYTPTDGRTVKISHVGIYIGTEKDGRHIMACATNGRSYRGKKGNGFGIYDFKLPSKTSKATFVGYGPPL